MYFSKKGVYHSWLQNKSPIVIQFTSDVKDSQYPNQSDFIWFRVRGDDDPEATYYYMIENGKIRQQLEGIDQSKWWKANFQSEEVEPGTFNAWITLDEAGDAPAQTYSSNNSNNSSSGGQRQTRGRYDVAPTVDLIAKYTTCLEAGLRIAEHALPDWSNEDARAIATSLYIAWQNRGFAGTLKGVVDEEAGEDTPTVDDDSTGADLQKQIARLEQTSGKAHDGTNLKTAIGKIEKAIEDGDIPIDSYMKMGLWLRKEYDHQQAVLAGADSDFDDELPF